MGGVNNVVSPWTGRRGAANGSSVGGGAERPRRHEAFQPPAARMQLLPAVLGEIDHHQSGGGQPFAEALARVHVTRRDQQAGGFEQRNLIGSPEEICARIRVYQQAGVTTCSGILFVANSVSEMREAVELFGREVIPNFTSRP